MVLNYNILRYHSSFFDPYFLTTNISKIKPFHSFILFFIYVFIYLFLNKTNPSTVIITGRCHQERIWQNRLNMLSMRYSFFFSMWDRQVFVFFHRYKRKVYRRTQNLLTGSSEISEEDLMVSFLVP